MLFHTVFCVCQTLMLKFSFGQILTRTQILVCGEAYFVLEQNLTHGCTFEKDLRKKLLHHFIVALELGYHITWRNMKGEVGT